MKLFYSDNEFINYFVVLGPKVFEKPVANRIKTETPESSCREQVIYFVSMNNNNDKNNNNLDCLLISKLNNFWMKPCSVIAISKPSSEIHSTKD